MVAGGVFMMKVKLLSANAVITTGSAGRAQDLGLRVERLAELHDVEAALTKGRADRGWGWLCLQEPAA